MDFTPTERVLQLRDQVEYFFNEKILPRNHEWEERVERQGEVWPDFLMDLRAEAKALGLWNMALPLLADDEPGTRLSNLEFASIAEILGRLPWASYVFNCNVPDVPNMEILQMFGTPEQKQRWLHPLLQGDTRSAFAMTEPAVASSDATNIATRIERDGDDYVINGGKAFISGGGQADVYVTMVRTGDDSAGGVSCIAIPKDAPGISFGAQERKMGWNSQPTAQVLFDDCRVPVENLVGEEGQGFKIAMMGLDGGRLNIGACSLGAARACLEAAQDYTADRKQFGSPVGDFQGIQFTLADMATELEAARLMIRQAAAKLDAKEPEATLYCAMAKRFATDVGFKVCNDALQLHGGYGYLRDFPIERYVRDTRVHQILEGTNEIMRVIISRALLKD